VKQIIIFSIVVLILLASPVLNALPLCSGGSWSSSINWYTGPAGDIYPQPIGTCSIGNQQFNYNVSWSVYWNIKFYDGL
jgi:hypothetical protein